MDLIIFDDNMEKEEKLKRIMAYLEELKSVFFEVVQEYEDEDAPEETVDLLTGALDAVEDAHDVILDVIEGDEDL